MLSKSPKISVLPTPNPQTLKFTWGQTLLTQGVINITNPETAGTHPLTRALFNLPDVASLMVGGDFISVSKTEEVDWHTVNPEQWLSLQETVVQLIQTYLAQDPQPQFQAWDRTPPASTAQGDAVSQKIQQILDQEIRPAVAQDGGDISFERFENGIVYLHLKGACSGCPSSTMTLKMGIENRLKQSLPEVREVVSI